MNINKINKTHEDKVTHYEMNVSRFELIIFAAALEKLIDFENINCPKSQDTKKLKNMLDDLKANFP